MNYKVDRIKRDFVLGGHKAAAIALVRERVEDIYFVSDFPLSSRENFYEPRLRNGLQKYRSI
ncbi:MAG: hypothetical protein PHI00_07595 [Atribacterota bacterium]|jgi:hypothetical protein|nr:hypothetical protein [Atribacterota bacterium]MDI9606940.1 hypothetical protein [Atribacterota bacterium]HOQ51402.1 hypothetical protein [Candidatus Atribacteria bacterium]HPZ40047.1 hypothetical protein [Candidatus Atribacteria bacterium]HQD32744.1 hypothetical protein [Candidatus Atribacteria bacterium]